MKLWEVGTGKLVKQYLGATHTQLRCQVCQRDLLNLEVVSVINK